MPDLRFLLKVSRPRFWFYIFGPYILGLIAGASEQSVLQNSHTWFALYFLFSANLLIYGINDIFDYETDKLNPKKKGYEELVTPDKRFILFIAICIVNIPFLIKAILIANFPARVFGVGFLFFSIFYSAPPIRAKTKPFLDSSFNILYVLPGFFGYSLITGEFPPVTVIVAGGLWTAAMHAYSAIPDIEADRNAGISTISTVLGSKGTHLFCLAAYIASAMLSYEFLGYFSIAAAALYSLIMIVSLRSKGREGVFRIYRIFPVVNALVGFLLFWYIAIPKFLLCIFMPCHSRP